jgi:hypothetical protein
LYAAVVAWLEWYNQYGIFGAFMGTEIGPGPGIANVHVATAVSAEEHFALYYPDDADILLGVPPDIYSRLDVLLGDEGNIRYMAAILRQLADWRTGVNSEHVSDLNDTDMDIIYTAFRAKLKGCYDNIDGFASASVPAADPRCHAGEITPFLEFYRLQIKRP